MLIDGGPEGCIVTSWTACEYFNRGCNCGKCNKKREKMDETITAEWARNESNRVLGEKVKSQLKQCETAIKVAAGKNDMSTTVSMYPHERTIQELRSRGFEVKHHKAIDQREGDYITINW